MTYEDIKELFDDDKYDDYDWILIILILFGFYDKHKTININIGGK